MESSSTARTITCSCGLACFLRACNHHTTDTILASETVCTLLAVALQHAVPFCTLCTAPHMCSMLRATAESPKQGHWPTPRGAIR
jgi:hypothetical protein